MPDADGQHRRRASQTTQSIVGLTGSKAAIDSAQLAAKIPPSKGRADHAAFVLAYTKDNLGHVIYPSGVGQDDLMQDFPALARETWAKVTE